MSELGSCMTRRNGNAVLAAIVPTAAGTVPTWQNVRQAGFEEIMFGQSEDGKSRPHVLTLSAAGPADVWVEWTGGGGFGGFCYFSMTQASRISFDANTIRVHARNRTAALNQFFSSMTEGDKHTHNGFVAEWAANAPPVPANIPIPPFATGVRMVSTRGAGTVATMNLNNAMGTIIGVQAVLGANVDPAIVTGAATLDLLGLIAGEVVTLLFDLMI